MAPGIGKMQDGHVQAGISGPNNLTTAGLPGMALFHRWRRGGRVFLEVTGSTDGCLSGVTQQGTQEGAVGYVFSSDKTRYL